MSRLIFAAAGLACLLATSALANTVGATQAGTGSQAAGQVDIYGHVDATCNIATASVTLDLQSIIDANGLYNKALDNKTATLTGWCNGAGSTMSVASTAVSTGGTSPVGFANAVDYTATAVANGKSASYVTSTGVASTPATVGAFTGANNIVVTFTASASHIDSNSGATPLLLSGNYHGTTTVTLTPGL